MKKSLFILFILGLFGLYLTGCYSSKYGTLQADRQVDVLEEEIKIAADELEDLGDGEKSPLVQEQLTAARQRLDSLIKAKDLIVWEFATSRDVPREMSCIEKEARLRANHIRREELVINKIESNLSSIRSDLGYKVILDNAYSQPITFAMHPVDGGEKVSVNVDARSRDVVYLLPGLYEVVFMHGGRAVGKSVRMKIDGQVHRYQGEECFGFAFMPIR